MIEASAASTQRLRRYLPAVILILLSAVIAVARLHTYHEPMERDLATYLLIGREMLNGRELYSDLWDHKPPAIHATYAAAVAIAGPGPGAVYLLNVGAALVTLLGVYAACSAAGMGVAAGLWASGFWTVISGDLFLEANQPNTEVFINACLIWVLALILKADATGLRTRYTLIAAGLITLSTLYKQVAVASAALLIAALFVMPTERCKLIRDRLRPAALMVGVSLLMWSSMVGYFALTGRLSDLVDNVVAYNLYYSGVAGAGTPIIYSGKSLDLAVLTPFMPLVLLVVTGAAIGLRTGPRRNWVLYLAFAAGTCFSVALPGHWFPHYFQLCLPVLAVGGGWSVVSIHRTVPHPVRALAHVCAAIIICLLVGKVAPYYVYSASEWSILKYGRIFVEAEHVAARIRSLLREGETLYEWGIEPQLYLLSDRRPPTGVFNIYPLVEGPFVSSFSARVIADLERQKPELFVAEVGALAMAGPPRPVLQWCLERYRPFPIDDEHGHFRLFARKGGALEKRLLAKAASQSAPN